MWSRLTYGPRASTTALGVRRSVSSWMTGEAPRCRRRSTGGKTSPSCRNADQIIFALDARPGDASPCVLVVGLPGGARPWRHRRDLLEPCVGRVEPDAAVSAPDPRAVTVADGAPAAERKGAALGLNRHGVVGRGDLVQAAVAGTGTSQHRYNVLLPRFDTGDVGGARRFVPGGDRAVREAEPNQLERSL